MEILAKERLVLMASYDYECAGDGEIITIERGMTEPEQEYACSICGSKLKRVYTAPPVKFNGTGFYSTGG
jgi:putative FmdB family regulatory protein